LGPFTGLGAGMERNAVYRVLNPPPRRTAGPSNEQHVDHLAHSAELTVRGLLGLPQIDASGLELSDHPGVFVQLARPDPA